MFVYFLRHASAGNPRANPAQDEKRPLDKQGIGQCRDVGRFLSALDVTVDVIISSPLKRATQTATLVGNELGYDSKLLFDPALRPEASFPKFRDMLRNYAKQEAVMVVGHNPSLSRFLSLFVTNGAFEKAVDLKKGSVARVESDGKQTVLNWLITPRHARTIQSESKVRSKSKEASAAQSDSKAARARPKTSRK